MDKRPGLGQASCDEDEIVALTAQLRELGEQLRVNRARLAEAGLFTDDRDLLECTACDLWEDVLVDGRLVTYPRGTPVEDTGLRFIEHADDSDAFTCPKCGATVRLPEVIDSFD